MPAILNYPSLANKPGRFYAFAAILVFILFCLWNNDGSVSSFRTGGGPKSAVESAYQEHATFELNITRWGEMGNRMRLMSGWAEHLVAHPTEKTSRFNDALVKEFSFLQGTEKTVYRPWSTTTPASRKISTGFVICAGSNNFRLAAHLIVNLRRVHKINTPIEIAYAGEEDLRPEHRQFLEELANDISFIDLLKSFPHAQDELVNSGWAMKPFALLASSHSRAILVDADALFLESPGDLFETNPGLERTGTLFFHDRAAVGGDMERVDFIKAQLADAGRSPSHYLQHESLFYSGAAWYEADSGLVAIDKSRIDVFIALIWATWMNTKEVREEISYRMFYGDKETFWIAMELSGVEYFFQPWYAGTMGTIEDSGDQKSSLDLAHEAYEICGTHMLHLDHKGEKPFWINGGIYEHKDVLERGYMKMTHYWVGSTQDIRDTQPNWYWKGNVGCIREKKVKIVPQSTSENIAMIIEEGKRIDKLAEEL